MTALLVQAKASRWQCCGSGRAVTGQWKGSDTGPPPLRLLTLSQVAQIDFEHAARYIAAVPEGCWTSYGDVASAGGNRLGSQAVGDWLRRHGDKVPHVHRVLRIDGFVPDAFRPAGPGIPADAEGVRELLRREGVFIDDRGRASAVQRFTVDDWRP